MCQTKCCALPFVITAVASQGTIKIGDETHIRNIYDVLGRLVAKQPGVLVPPELVKHATRDLRVGHLEGLEGRVSWHIYSDHDPL